jgi:CRP-like cAMP-binding protein
MKKFPLLLTAIVAIVLGAVIFAQGQMNAALKRTVSSLRKEVDALAAQADKDRRQTAELSSKNEIFKNESADLRKKLAAGGGTAPGETGTAATGERSENRGANFMKGFAKMFTDPESKKAMRGQQSMVVRMMYGDLAKELGLSREEANQLMELLTERQMSMATRGMELMGGDGADPKKVEASRKEIEQSRADYDAQINGLLGEARAEKFAEYERTVGDRMQMQQYQQAFTAAGVPLQDTQRDSLIAIMKEERMKMPESPFQPGNQNAAAQIKAMQTGEGLDQAMRQMEEFNARVLPRARVLLSPEQANTFEAAQKQQLEMMQLGLKMSREMFKK